MYLSHMGYKKYTTKKILLKKVEGMRPLGKPNTDQRLVSNWTFKELGCEDVLLMAFL
jgi:hypothetical protein